MSGERLVKSKERLSRKGVRLRIEMTTARHAKSQSNENRQKFNAVRYKFGIYPAKLERVFSLRLGGYDRQGERTNLSKGFVSTEQDAKEK